MRRYWMSFCSSETGENLGVCVVEVSEAQAEEAVEILKGIHGESVPEGHEWMAAAVGQSLLMECNPGGDVQMIQIEPESTSRLASEPTAQHSRAAPERLGIRTSRDVERRLQLPAR